MGTIFLGGNKWWRIIMVGTATSNVNMLLSFYSQIMGLRVSRPKYYLLLWVNSWPKKWKNRFFTLRVTLTDGSQLRSWGFTPNATDQYPPVPHYSKEIRRNSHFQEEGGWVGVGSVQLYPQRSWNTRKSTVQLLELGTSTIANNLGGIRGRWEYKRAAVG